MEFLKNTRKPRVMAAGMLLVLTGCSSIQVNDEIVDCEGDGLIEATTDPKRDDYDKSTDPIVLGNVMYDQAERIQEGDNQGWDITLRSQVVGIGEIACMGEGNQLYLNSEGARLSADYRKAN